MASEESLLGERSGPVEEELSPVFCCFELGDKIGDGVLVFSDTSMGSSRVENR